MTESEVQGMRIAILSMQRVENYGSVLQAWSLREMVRELTGDLPEFLDIESAPVLRSKAKNLETNEYGQAHQLSRGILQRGKRWCFTRLSRWKKKSIRRFMQCELHLDEPVNNHFDCAIIGSDEVFNHARGISLQLHGKVKQADKVITYAACCGSAKPEDIPDEALPQVCEAMRNIQALSVRDANTARYAARLYDGGIVEHLDPVLVGSLYARKVKKVPLKKYMLIYAYGQRIHSQAEIDAIKAYAKARNLKTVAVGGTQYWCDLLVPASPMRVLDWFAHAECVVTDTFHGAVFSVITHRRFAAIIRPSNRGKLEDLLNRLELTDRRANDMTRLGQILDTPVDYDATEVILARERQRTREYLKEQLSDGEKAHSPV